jgi:hypothetical protein
MQPILSNQEAGRECITRCETPERRCGWSALLALSACSSIPKTLSLLPIDGTCIQPTGAGWQPAAGWHPAPLRLLVAICAGLRRKKSLLSISSPRGAPGIPARRDRAWANNGATRSGALSTWRTSIKKSMVGLRGSWSALGLEQTQATNAASVGVGATDRVSGMRWLPARLIATDGLTNIDTWPRNRSDPRGRVRTSVRGSRRRARPSGEARGKPASTGPPETPAPSASAWHSPTARP